MEFNNKDNRTVVFSYLHTVDRQPRSCVKFLVTDVTFEMFRFLMLNQNLFLVKFSVAIPVLG